MGLYSVLLALIHLLPPPSAQSQAGPRCFNVPGITHCITGRFREYWEQNGGLPVFGYPLTSADYAPNHNTGRTVLTQWFERARFEHHTENDAPYDVLLGRFGDEHLRQLGTDWRTLPREREPQPSCLWFPQTGHNVCDQTPRFGFKAFWQSHGLQDPRLTPYERSLALFGLPLTPARMETLRGGTQIVTQWFERARFEWHPDQPDEYKVLLALIANEVRADPVLVGAGDIASCDSTGDEMTARLLDEMSGTVFTAGDNAYPAGTAAEFTNCYTPSWGRHQTRTRPAVGNAEYRTTGAASHFTYFGAAAGDPREGYYSYDLGAWHIMVLNSNCAEVGGCHAGSPQERWLRADLQAHPTVCALAYWHHPRFSSGGNGNSLAMQPIWQVLYAAKVEVVINGHDHNYERFAPQRPDGRRDEAGGIRQFVVGTGGNGLGQLGTRQPNSQAWNNSTYGVLKVTLHQTSYDWQFVPQAGKTFTDTGSAACH